MKSNLTKGVYMSHEEAVNNTLNRIRPVLEKSLISGIVDTQCETFSGYCETAKKVATLEELNRLSGELTLSLPNAFIKCQDRFNKFMGQVEKILRLGCVYKLFNEDVLVENLTGLVGQLNKVCRDKDDQGKIVDCIGFYLAVKDGLLSPTIYCEHDLDAAQLTNEQLKTDPRSVLYMVCCTQSFTIMDESKLHEQREEASKKGHLLNLSQVVYGTYLFPQLFSAENGEPEGVLALRSSAGELVPYVKKTSKGVRISKVSRDQPIKNFTFLAAKRLVDAYGELDL